MRPMLKNSDPKEANNYQIILYTEINIEYNSEK